MEGWRPLATQARIAQVAEPNARRYASAFPQFFPARKMGRVVVYAPETVDILKAIADAFGEKKARPEVEEMLAGRFTRTHDVELSPPPTPAPAAQGGVDLESLQGMGTLVNVLADLSRSFQKLVENQERILEEMRLTRMAMEASQGYQDASKSLGEGNRRPHYQTGQDKPMVNVVVDRNVVIAKVMALHREGLGQHAITTRLRREGLRMSARGDISKSTVARILNGEAR